jgi:hypothetical protein
MRVTRARTNSMRFSAYHCAGVQGDVVRFAAKELLAQRR